MSRLLVTMQSCAVFSAFSVLLPSPHHPTSILALPQTVLPTQEADCVQLAATVHLLGQILNPGRSPRASAHTMAPVLSLKSSPCHLSLLGLPHLPPLVHLYSGHL